jgi:hypothetical protein
MQNSVGYFANVIQFRERPRKRDPLLRGPAASESPPSMIEAELPVRQTVLIHKLSGQGRGLCYVHRGVTSGFFGNDSFSTDRLQQGRPVQFHLHRPHPLDFPKGLGIGWRLRGD